MTGFWEGQDADYAGTAVEIPDEFREAIQRKTELFDVLVEVLREPARSMGLSAYQSKHWLPRAQSVLAKADAIVGSSISTSA